MRKTSTLAFLLAASAATSMDEKKTDYIDVSGLNLTAVSSPSGNLFKRARYSIPSLNSGSYYQISRTGASYHQTSFTVSGSNVVHHYVLDTVDVDRCVNTGSCHYYIAFSCGSYVSSCTTENTFSPKSQSLSVIVLNTGVTTRYFTTGTVQLEVPIDGGWSSWTGSCPRTRSCTNPTPQYGGSSCVGSSTDSSGCATGGGSSGSSSSGSNDGGAIAGIVIGSLIGLAIIGWACWYCMYKYQRTSPSDKNATPGVTTTMVAVSSAAVEEQTHAQSSIDSAPPDYYPTYPTSEAPNGKIIQFPSIETLAIDLNVPQLLELSASKGITSLELSKMKFTEMSGYGITPEQFLAIKSKLSMKP